MSVKCLLDSHGRYNIAGPEAMIDRVKSKTARKHDTCTGRRAFGITFNKTVVQKMDFGARRTLAELGNIDLQRGQKLYVIGDRNSILDLFNHADQIPEISVGLPPGVFVEVGREENCLSPDKLAIRISSGTNTSARPRSLNEIHPNIPTVVKNGNCYRKDFGKKSLIWNLIEITKELGVDAKGAITLHPKAFVLPLKNLFDKNKWW